MLYPHFPIAPDHEDQVGSTTPPANASGTPSKKPILSGVDGAAIDGNHSRRFKTQFPTAMRLDRETKAYALAAGFEPDRIQLMFEVFRDFNIAQGNYSVDWRDVWFNWVDREVNLVDERHDRARAREYWAHQ